MNGVVVATGAVGLLLIYGGIVRRPTRPTPVRDRLAELIVTAGVTWTASRLAVTAIGMGIAAAIVASVFVPSPLVAFLAAAAGAYSPISFLRARRHRRRGRLREAWPDAIAGLVSSIRASASLGEACTALSSRGPAELRGAFGSFRSTYRASGSFEAGLLRLQEQLGDPVADRVVAALGVAHQVGGTDLVRVLRTLGDFIREDVRVRREIEARWSWTVTAARVAAAAPWIVLAMMATRPEAARAYNSPSGIVVVAAGAIATIVGYRLMLRAARLPDDGRLRHD